MIIWLYGQPGHGKTTLANELVKYFNMVPCVHIDGDDLRAITDNLNYDRTGREQNIECARLIARFLNKKSITVIVSLVTPYRESRDKFALENGVKMIYLHRSSSERDHFKVTDFETSDDFSINTDNSIEECTNKILQFLI
jgi:adenylylsulfate kinase-like enzyme